MRKPDRRRTPAEGRIELREQVLALRREGRPLAEISALTGYAPTYCSTLARRFEHEPAAARKLNRGGRPIGAGRRLKAQQEVQAQRWICDRFPDQLKLPFALWSRRAVQELMRVRFGVRLPIRTVGLYLERWGFTPQRPTRRAYERDDAAVKRWLEEDFPRIACRAKRETAEICWGDETGLRSDETRHRGYAPKGKTPVIRIPARRKSLSVISAVTNQGKARFMIFKGALSPTLLLRFLSRLIRDADRKVFLILDNLGIHKSRRVRDWVAERRAKIELFFLPPYSPELNPDEYLNGDLKRAVHSGIPPRDESELHGQALGQLRRIQKTPRRVRSYFRNPAVRYAA